MEMDKRTELDVQYCTFLMARRVNPALAHVTRGDRNRPVRVVYVRQAHAKQGKANYCFLPHTHPAGYGSDFVPCNVPLRACDEMLDIIATHNNPGVMFALREVTK
jgi:hypothetical protein